MIRRRRPVRSLLWSALAAPIAVSTVSSLAWAGKPPPDTDLLEFLGSVDSEDGSWSRYLGSTDPDQVAKPGAPKAPAKSTPAGARGAKPPAPAQVSPPRTPAAKAGA